MTGAGTKGAPKKPRITILGAGPAGLSTAFGLARTGLYDIHVYQVGWRAGGKCATGRDPKYRRARQNGSHYLFGCYHNAFELIREAHDIIEKKGDPATDRFGSFRTDFVSRNLLVGFHRYETKKRDRHEGDWFRYLPQNLDTPGTGNKFPSPFDLGFMLVQFGVGTLIDIISSMVYFRSESERFSGVRFFLKLFPVSPFETGLYARFVRAVLLLIRWIFNNLVWTPLAFLAFGLRALFRFLIPGRPLRWFRRQWQALWPKVVWLVRRSSRKILDVLLRAPANMARRAERIFILFDLGLTILVGYYADDLNLPGGFDAIDEHDFRAWLKRHEAHEITVGSAIVTTWYDAVIAYRGGKQKDADTSAGVCVHSMLRSLLSYKGAFAYQMRAEVGDSYIAPVVRALELLGVKFHFYHRVNHVVVDEGSRVVSRIELSRQSNEDKIGAEFVDVMDRRGKKTFLRKAWPDHPLRPIPTPADGRSIDSYYSTFALGTTTLTRRTELGNEGSGDFDLVVCALPIGVVDDVLVDSQGHRIGAQPGRWRECHQNIPFTESQSIRAWFQVPLGPKKRNGRNLGWQQDPPILSGYDWPYSTWEDNSQAVNVQNFPEDQQPYAIATVFGPLETGALDVRDPRHETIQQERVQRAARHFIENSMLRLWPGLEDPPGSKQVNWPSFVDLDGRTGAGRFDWQHVSANVGPAESYVMCFPKTLRFRLRPDESGFRNLFLAGDWTRNGVEVGTVEGAVISGLKAARAISGTPIPIVGGDDLERGTLFS